MIRKLKKEDQQEVLAYLYQDASFNIFMIGDIEAFGMETDFQRVYGEYQKDGSLKSLFLRYHDYAIYYSHIHTFNLDYLKIFREDPFKFISGKTELIELIYPYLDGFGIKNMYFCEMKASIVPAINDSRIKFLNNEDDAARLYDLLVSIEKFGYAKSHTKERFIKEKSNDQSFGITLFIDDGDKVVATASTSAETTKNAMVIAVATAKNYRNQGLGTLLVQKLLDIYINEKGKSLCLSYDNISAGKIYHRLGFETIGKWSSCNKF